MDQHRQASAKSASLSSDGWLEEVRRQVGSLQFGVVQIVVHNARITQIDRTERLRLDPPPVLPLSSSPHLWKE